MFGVGFLDDFNQKNVISDPVNTQRGSYNEAIDLTRTLQPELPVMALDPDVIEMEWQNMAEPIHILDKAPIDPIHILDEAPAPTAVSLKNEVVGVLSY